MTAARARRKDRRARRAPSPWPLTVMIVALLIQLVAFTVLNVFNVLDLTLTDTTSMSPEEAAALFLDVLVVAILLAFMDVVVLIALVLVIRRSRSAWVSALLVQGLTLAAGLLLYSEGDRSWVTYALLAYGLVVVVYLLVPGVQGAFLPPGERAGQTFVRTH